MGKTQGDQHSEATVTLVDGFLPPLPGGTYSVEARQALKLQGGSPTFDPVTKLVRVSAPRFALGPGDLYSVYPPEGQSGSYHDTLPHVVLTRKTLPWERTLGGAAHGSETSDRLLRPPWVALLTLDEAELEKNAVRIHSAPVEQFFAKSPGTILPAIAPEGEPIRSTGHEELAAECLAVDMPLSLFDKVAPTLDELPYLVHARQVGSEDKDLADIVSDGWVSVVIGNRLPSDAERSHGLLVSLEGFGGILRRDKAAARRISADRIRLAVLKHWTYSSDGPTFRELLEGLAKGRGDDNRTEVWLRVSPSAAGMSDDVSEGDAALVNALRLGYAALSHTTRQGDHTVSWYRGPLVPAPQEVEPFPTIHPNADAALHYDADTGLFDVSYAAAWQLGRLLALQRRNFGASLLHRRAGIVEQKVLAEAHRRLPVPPGNSGRPLEAVSEKARLLLQNDLILAMVMQMWPLDAGE